MSHAQLVAVGYLVAAAVYLGFQWTIRAVVYPQLARVGAAEFVTYELAHQRAVSLVVGPLFAALAGACVAVLVVSGGWRGVPAIALLAALLAVTAVGAVPQHRMLSRAFEPAAHGRLLVVDGVRLLLAVLQVLLGLAQLLLA